MPAISTPATVLVTGANGYLAIWVVKTLLEKGYNVRGIARSDEKGEHPKKVFAEYGSKFEFIIVPDVNKPGAYDEVVEGVDAIQSVAAPIPHKVGHPDEIVKPAVEGTLGLLESARKAGTVKRVVITSTAVAVMEQKEGEYEYTEADWNDTALKYFNQLGAKSPGRLIYAASKVLLERAIQDYVKTQEGSLPFDVVYMLPPSIFGVSPIPQAFAPPLNEVASLGIVDKYSSLGALYIGLTQAENLPDWLLDFDTWIDVRDTAETHVLAMTTEEAANKRILTAAGPFTWHNAYEALNAVKPQLPGTPVGIPGNIKKDVIPEKTYNNSLSLKLFPGFKYRSLQETVGDAWLEFIKRGWITTEGKATVTATGRD